MSERCTIREFVDTLYPDVEEPYIPDECIRCLYKALASGMATREIIKTDASAELYLKAYYGDDINVEDASRWELTSFSNPDDTTAREAQIRHGFDIATQSYEAGSTIQTQQVRFDCTND